MKTILSSLSLLAVVFALAMPAAALSRHDVDRFNDFLTDHPRIADDLSRDPNLVNNWGYVDSHPDLHRFLDRHEEIREALQRHPGRFVSREGRRWWGYEGPWSESERPWER